MIDGANRYIADEQGMVALGTELTNYFASGQVISLEGDLGAGKTTLVRGYLRALGHSGIVKSPTYTLVESYGVAPYTVYHFDLYRLAEPEELEDMGFRDYVRADSLCFIEWAEKAEPYLPPLQWVVRIEREGSGRRVFIKKQ